MLNSNSYYLNSFVNRNQNLLELEEEILQKAQFIKISADIVKDTSKDLLYEDKIYMEWFRDMMEYDYLKGCFIDDKKTYKKLEVNKLIDDALLGKFEYNRFFVPNQGIYDKRGKKRDENGLIKYDYFTEKRSEDKIKDLKCFYIDIDIKDENGKSYVKDIDVENKKRQLLSELKKLWKKNEYSLETHSDTNLDQIIVPSIVIESRNGFHLYYVIDLNWYDESSKKWGTQYPDLQEWKELEKIILLTYKKFIPIVDNAVVSPGQLLRFPYTIHEKNKKQNPFLVRILFMGRKYTMDELSIDFIFGMDEEMLSEVYPDEYPNVDKSETHRKEKSKIDKKKTFLSDENFSKNLPSSQLVTAIQNLDIEYFRNNLGEVQHQVFEDRHEAIDYIVRQDMSKLLNIKCSENFCSPFRVDNTPSCSIFMKKDGIYRFYDNARKDAIQGSILDIIQKVANVSLTKAVDFLAEVYNITTNSFQPYLNLSQLDEIIHYNEDLFSENIKLNKLNKKLIILYKECLEFWKEKCIENQSIPFMKHDIMISNDTMFKRLQEKYLDGNPFKRPQDLTRRFMQLEALGVVNLIRGKNFNTETKTRAARVYQFKKINANEFSIKCMILKRKCPNIREMSEKIIRIVDMFYEAECKKKLISKLIQIMNNVK